MPYNPGVAAIPLGGVTPMGAQYYAQGAQNFQNSIASGIDRWYQNDRQDTQTRAQVAAMLPTFADNLTNPEDHKLVEKFINHKTDYKDNAYLLGVLTTHQQQEQIKLQNAASRSQTYLNTVAGQEHEAQAGLAGAQGDLLSLKAALMRRAVGMGQQGQPGAGISSRFLPHGSGVNVIAQPARGGAAPAPVAPQAPSAPQDQGPMPVQPGSSIQVENPYGFSTNSAQDDQIFQQDYINNYGAMPEAAAIDARRAARQKWLDEPHFVGHVPVGYATDEDGNPTAKLAMPVSMKPGQPGKLIYGEKPIELPPSGPSAIPLIDAKGNPIHETEATFGTPYNPNKKGAQTELREAQSSVLNTQQNLGTAKFFQKAVDAYASDPASGARLNALLGTESGQKLRQMFGPAKGRNAAGMIQAAKGELYKTMIDNLRNEKTGANALRTITQQELQQLQAQYGDAEMTHGVLKALAYNTVAVMQRHYDMTKMYTGLRQKGMRPTDAEAKVLDAFPEPVLRNLPPADGSTENTTDAILAKYKIKPKAR